MRLFTYALSASFGSHSSLRRSNSSFEIAFPCGLPADYYSRYIESIAAVTPDAANAALRGRIHPSDLVITVVGTKETTLEAVRAAIPGLASEEIVAYDLEAREKS